MTSAHIIQNRLSFQSSLIIQKREFQTKSFDMKVSSKWLATEPKFDFNLLGGLFSVKDNLNDIVNFFNNPELFAQSGIKPIKGVILSGAPGTGKTMIAEAIAGEAWKANVKIIKIAASALLGKFVGDCESNLKALFLAAQEQQPCILLIDEIDSIGNARTQFPQFANEQSQNTIVNMLLSLLDQDLGKVVVIGTTNRYSALDEALVREGRFDRHIVVPLPNHEERKQIFAIHMGNKKIDPEVDVEMLAAESSGYSGAKIAAWVNEAALQAFRNKSERITSLHFDNANILLEFGSLGREHATLKHKWQVACHEVGHSLVAYLLGLEVKKISILDYGRLKGYSSILGSKENVNGTKSDLLNQICSTLGGRAAELLVGTEMVGSTNDLKVAISIANKMVQTEGMGSTLIGLNSGIDVEHILQGELQRALDLLKANKKTFDKVVKMLVERQVLSGEDFKNAVKGIPLIAPTLWQTQATIKEENIEVNKMDQEVSFKR